MPPKKPSGSQFAKKREALGKTKKQLSKTLNNWMQSTSVSQPNTEASTASTSHFDSPSADITDSVVEYDNSGPTAVPADANISPLSSEELNIHIVGDEGASVVEDSNGVH